MVTVEDNSSSIEYGRWRRRILLDVLLGVDRRGREAGFRFLWVGQALHSAPSLLLRLAGGVSLAAKRNLSCTWHS